MPNNLIIKSQRNDIINQLASFCATDTLLYLPDCLETTNALHTVNQILKTKYQLCQGINVSTQNIKQEQHIKQYLYSLETDELAFTWHIGKELQSVLIAILLATHRLDVHQAFALAFYEELHQQTTWGQTEEINQRHHHILQTLQQLEQTYDKRSIS